MDIHEAEQLVNEHMRDYGLHDAGWVFRWDNSKNRFGVCKYTQRVIGLSVNLVRLNDQDQVLDTILHEIAHALVGHGHGHDDVWKAKCVEIGARPERCYQRDVPRPMGRWTATCQGCNAVYDRHKAPKTGTIYYCRCRAPKQDRRLIFGDLAAYAAERARRKRRAEQSRLCRLRKKEREQMIFGT